MCPQTGRWEITTEKIHKKENNIRTESIITLSECKRTKWCESCKVDFPNENPKIGSDLVVVQKESMCVWTSTVL